MTSPAESFDGSKALKDSNPMSARGMKQGLKRLRGVSPQGLEKSRRGRAHGGSHASRFAVGSALKGRKTSWEEFLSGRVTVSCKNCISEGLCRGAKV